MSEKKGKGSKMKKLLLGFVSIIVSIVVAAMSAAYIAEFKNIMDDIINSGELESIVQDAVDSSIDDLETMEPDAEENKLSGIWLINDALSFTDEMFDENVEFVSNSVAYSRFVVIDARIYYETDANSSSYTNMIYDGQMTTEFTDNAYRYVAFDGDGQIVSAEFKAWFTKVAEEVSPEAEAIILLNASESYNYDPDTNGYDDFSFRTMSINGFDVSNVVFNLSPGGNCYLGFIENNSSDGNLRYIFRYENSVLTENNMLEFSSDADAILFYDTVFKGSDPNICWGDMRTMVGAKIIGVIE